MAHEPPRAVYLTPGGPMGIDFGEVIRTAITLWMAEVIT